MSDSDTIVWVLVGIFAFFLFIFIVWLFYPRSETITFSQPPDAYLYEPSNENQTSYVSQSYVQPFSQAEDDVYYAPISRRFRSKKRIGTGNMSKFQVFKKYQLPIKKQKLKELQSDLENMDRRFNDKTIYVDDEELNDRSKLQNAIIDIKQNITRSENS